jgi:hypothetical protein
MVAATSSTHSLPPVAMPWIVSSLGGWRAWDETAGAAEEGLDNLSRVSGGREYERPLCGSKSKIQGSYSKRAELDNEHICYLLVTEDEGTAWA